VKMADAFKKAGEYVLTQHAKERIRQRVGITSEETAVAWVREMVEKAAEKRQEGDKTRYITDSFELILSGVKVITVIPAEQANDYLAKFSDVVAKEASKLLKHYKRELRKTEIAIAEAQLNYLKARNPNVKERIKKKLVEAIDYKAMVDDEIKKIELAAERFGVEATK